MENFRRFINKQDDLILDLFQKRLLCVLKIFKIKQSKKLNITDFKRELRILNRISNRSIQKLKKYNILLFLNILTISKILQYENLLYSFNKKDDRLKDKSNFKKHVKIAIFKDLSDIKIFNSASFFKYKSFDVAIKNLKNNMVDFAIFKVYNFQKNICVLAAKNKIYANLAVKHGKAKYVMFSNGIYFKKGINNFILSFVVEDSKYIFLNISNLFIINKISILNFSLKKTLNGKFKIYLNFLCFLSSKLEMFKILNYFKNNAKELKIFGIFKIILN